MTLLAIVAAPPAQAEFARQGLISVFLDTENGRLTPRAEPAGAQKLADAPLAAFAVQADHSEPKAVRAALAAMFAGHPIDWCVRESGPFDARLVVCDMDSTIIGCECIDELGAALGLGGRIAAITEAAMRGEVDFAGALEQRTALLKDAPLSLLEEVWRERIADRINPGARTMIATLKAHGAFTALVSGGFTFFAARVAAEVGFDVAEANVLEDQNGVLTGQVRKPILGPDAKLSALERLSFDHGDGPESAMAIGDGANDLAMMGAAGVSVAYRAKPVVAQAADARIQSGDLRSVLMFLQIPVTDWIMVD